MTFILKLKTYLCIENYPNNFSLISLYSIIMLITIFLFAITASNPGYAQPLFKNKNCQNLCYNENDDFMLDKKQKRVSLTENFDISKYESPCFPTMKFTSPFNLNQIIKNN